MFRDIFQNISDFFFFESLRTTRRGDGDHPVTQSLDGKLSDHVKGHNQNLRLIHCEFGL